MGPDLVLWEPGSAGRMEAEGLPAVVADEGDPPGRLRRHSPDKSGSPNRWGGSAGRLAADWTLWEAGSAGRMGPDLVLWEPGSAGRMEAEGLPAVLLMREIRQGACGAIRPINRAPTIGGVARPGAWRLTGPCGRPGLALWEAGSAGRMGPDLVLWEPGSAGRMEAEGLPAVVASVGACR